MDRGYVTYKSRILPPKRLRPCGRKYKDNDFYLRSARKRANLLIGQLGLSDESSLLDVGSGPGRLAIGIADRVGDIKRYVGMDVDEEAVSWGSKYITPEHPNFLFLHIDVENRRYNPEAPLSDTQFVFPFDDEEFDIITLYSVFTHMLTDGVRAYLREFRRLLKPQGKIHLSAFLEDGVPDVEENPQGYLQEWEGHLHCVRYNRVFFGRLVDEAGLRVERIARRKERPGGWWGQRGVFVSRRS
jgi:SAM-dependent methyltransferase